MDLINNLIQRLRRGKIEEEKKGKEKKEEEEYKPLDNIKYEIDLGMFKRYDEIVKLEKNLSIIEDKIKDKVGEDIYGYIMTFVGIDKKSMIGEKDNNIKIYYDNFIM